MNVIESMKQVLSDFPKLQELPVAEGIHIDFTEDNAENYGLSSIGDRMIKKDIMGNQTRCNDMILYAVSCNVNDADRLANSSLLLELGYYLEGLRRIPVTATIGTEEMVGKITSITAANGMAYTISEDGQHMKYQLQLKVIYTLESEE